MIQPVHITPHSRNAIGGMIQTTVTTLDSATSNTATANLVICYPFHLQEPFPIQKAFCLNGATAAGNVDIGVYTMEGTRLCSVGSTAQSGTNAIQEFNLSYTLGVGMYLLAIASDSGTATFFTQGLGQNRNIAGGVFIQSSGWSSGLPAAATLAVGAQTQIYVFGISRRSFI